MFIGLGVTNSVWGLGFRLIVGFEAFRGLHVGVSGIDRLQGPLYECFHGTPQSYCSRSVSSTHARGRC